MYKQNEGKNWNNKFKNIIIQAKELITYKYLIN